MINAAGQPRGITLNRTTCKSACTGTPRSAATAVGVTYQATRKMINATKNPSPRVKSSITTLRSTIRTAANTVRMPVVTQFIGTDPTDLKPVDNSSSELDVSVQQSSHVVEDGPIAAEYRRCRAHRAHVPARHARRLALRAVRGMSGCVRARANGESPQTRL